MRVEVPSCLTHAHAHEHELYRASVGGRGTRHGDGIGRQNIYERSLTSLPGNEPSGTSEHGRAVLFLFHFSCSQGRRGGRAGNRCPLKSTGAFG